MINMASTKTLADQLRDTRWAEVRIGETVIAYICPACASLVAEGSGSVRLNTEHHIRALHDD